MKTKSILIAIITLFALTSLADKLYDYSEQLNNEFTTAKTTKLIKVTAVPRLLERDFAKFLIDAFEKKETRKEIIAKWRPIQKKMLNEGFVFEIELELLNKNLDSGIEVNLVGDIINKFTLGNNLGEHAAMYKFTGQKNTSLNFMNPKIKLLCFFNTQTEKGNPLIKKGVTSLTINIDKLADNVPEIALKWSVPLNYFNVRRPAEMKAMFGTRPLRTIRVYKKQVYHKSKSSAIPHIKRIKREEETADE
jgi:hypothetical protein